jgi:POT family proton-dependent oligopeptide transporter
MEKTQYRTTPTKTDKMPSGIPYIVGNEAAERFSYYGMNSILVVFMTKYMLDAQRQPDHLSDPQAEAWYHTFVSAAYFLPLAGAFLADAILGKFRTILLLSIVYCFGHFTLALNETRTGLALGLGLIALGAGGIKPCVSANVGDQFGPGNQQLLTRVFSWFYFSVNLGSALSTMLIPELLDRYGPKVAFGTPGVAMFVATLIFWLGRKKFVHIPPAGLGRFGKEFLQPENLRAIGNLLILVPFAAMFWALWQQNFSSWVLQADKMDRVLFGHAWLPAQIQTVNSVFVLAWLPIFSYAIYPVVGRFVQLTPLRKFGGGLFMILCAFLLVALIQKRLDAGLQPNIIYQILAYLLLAAGEVMVSVTHLEFAYMQGPKSMKSLVMCTYLGSIALGNAFTAGVNFFIQNADGTLKLSGASYFYFFVKIMLVTCVAYVLVARFYRGKTYLQDEQSTS